MAISTCPDNGQLTGWTIWGNRGGQAHSTKETNQHVRIPKQGGFIKDGTHNWARSASARLGRDAPNRIQNWAESSMLRLSDSDVHGCFGTCAPNGLYCPSHRMQMGPRIPVMPSSLFLSTGVEK
ncbi:hypothetical protein IAQ61_008050 [Plenodomus lingam]|uniref:uncharacterized protein n=1 Tax=Leptosphaeria maculans TaxID=5022 RepID=UPI0033301579|nr:hypothetical protein IAQ61_008050 [Plenodomus lingam]